MDMQRRNKLKEERTEPLTPEEEAALERWVDTSGASFDEAYRALDIDPPRTYIPPSGTEKDNFQLPKLVSSGNSGRGVMPFEREFDPEMTGDVSLLSAEQQATNLKGIEAARDAIAQALENTKK